MVDRNDSKLLHWTILHIDTQKVGVGRGVEITKFTNHNRKRKRIV